jgi:hypothetical protein
MEIIDFYVRLAFKKLTHSSGFRVDQIIVFDEGDDAIVFCENVDTRWTVDEIKRKIKLDMYRIEIRYIVHGKKYRAIIREFDDVHFPIRKELGMTNLKIVKATIDGADFTKRILKYAGQNNDFNFHIGCLVFARDMFPFHDVDDRVLRIEFDDGTVKEFFANDLVI